MKIESVPVNEIKELCFVRLNPGDDLLEGIRKAVEKSGAQNGVILSGIGSVTSHSFHVVSSSVNPPDNAYVKNNAPADIVNINGFIINGRVHAHIIFSDTTSAYGGHLEEGVTVLTFAILTIAVVDRNFEKWDSAGAIEDLQQCATP
jgi:predicted DNA-binding protein with PD1-like motif